MGRWLTGKRRVNWAWANDDGSASGQGVSEIDFGTTGADSASVTTPSQNSGVGIKTAAKCEAWLAADAAASDGTTAAQHAADAPEIGLTCGAVSGAGGTFTITGKTREEGRLAGASISTGTGAGNLDTTVWTSPNDGKKRLLWSVYIHVRQAMTGSGSIVVTIGSTAGGVEWFASFTINNTIAAGVYKGLVSAEWGSSFGADGNAPIAANTNVVVRCAKSGTISQQAIVDVHVFGGNLALA
jgi:hypothetical protein